MRERLVVPAVGVVLSFILLGPGLGPGELLNLDLVATRNWPNPRAVWGLGPELGRAIPLEVALAFVASVTSGSFAVKALYVASIVGAFSGMYLLVEGLGLNRLQRWSSAALYATSPFFMTRMAVGHLTMVAAMAVLPWVHRRLVDPSSPAKFFVPAAAMAVMGFYGGMLAGICLLAALWGVGRSLRVRMLAIALVAQLVWLAPGVVLLAQGPRLGSSSAFPSGLSRWDAPFRLVTGHGFWQGRFQVGGTVSVVVVVGTIVLVLSWIGMREVDRTWSNRAASLAIGVSVLILADATPGLAQAVSAVTGLPLLSALREPHRLAPLLLLPVSVWVPAGAGALAAKVNRTWATAVSLVPLSVAAVLAAPGVWGLAGQLDPVPTPQGWTEARQLIAGDPGPAIVLPWNRYLNVSRADARVLNPAVQFFGPDVIAANDLELGDPTAETVDPRVDRVTDLILDMRSGGTVGDRLAQIGVRWVIITHDADYQPFLALLQDPALTPLLADRSIDLLQVAAWVGPVSTDESEAVGVHRTIAPLAVLERGTSGKWAEPWAAGWMQGLSPARSSPTGTVQLPGGSRVIWYWPSLLVVLSYAVWSVAFIYYRRQ